ncbi:MAG TPA: hypothetical protein P5181_05595 [Dermatophilaceae bacterium]|nr:hypothetical protein [Dermatophilaceae bacterium]
MARSVTRYAAWAPLAVGVLLAGACTGPPAPSSTGPTTPVPEATAVAEARWSDLGPPDGEAVVTLAAYRNGVLVGTMTRDPAMVPGLWSLAGGRWARLPVRGVSPYAPLAEWLDLEVLPGDGVVAVGGARGGAHANVRWTVWKGSIADGLVEQEQPFNVFGGWGAGDQKAVVATGAGPMLVGSWASARTGLDIGIWLPQGERWVRQDPAGTVLESSPSALTSAQAAAGWGDGALVVGSVVRLVDGVQQLPAAWRSARGNEGWSRVELPDGGRLGDAQSVACDGSGCVVAGVVDGGLAAWRIDASGAARRLVGLPEVVLHEGDPPPVALLASGRAVLLATDQSAGQGSAAGPGIMVLREQAGGWSRAPGPPGVLVTAVVGPDGTLYAAARQPSAPTRLWATTPAQ